MINKLYFSNLNKIYELMKKTNADDIKTKTNSLIWFRLSGLVCRAWL